MATADLEKLVREMADRESIRDLPLRYCDAVWRQDGAAVAELYTEDGFFDPGLGIGAFESRRAIRDYMVPSLENGRPLPFIHNHVFEVDGDRAAGRCSVEIRITHEGVERIGVGFYEDEYARVDGEWKFRSRKATLLSSPVD